MRRYRYIAGALVLFTVALYTAHLFIVTVIVAVRAVIALFVTRFTRTKSIVDDVTEPLFIGRCPVCKSPNIYPVYPVDGEPPLWNCRHCLFEFDPLDRVRQRNRLYQVWRETTKD